MNLQGTERKDKMIKELVLKNRSYRSFDRSVKIEKDTLLELIDCARLTPSARNAQPLLYIPLTEKGADRILPYTAWAKALPDLKLPPNGKEPTAFILMCIDKNATPNAGIAMKDVGISAQTILLAATEIGLGGCMLGSFDNAKIKAELGLDNNIDIVLAIALGKPSETVVLEEMEKTDSVNYYRDAKDVHHVPKRKLEDIIIDVK